MSSNRYMILVLSIILTSFSSWEDSTRYLTSIPMSILNQSLLQLLLCLSPSFATISSTTTSVRDDVLAETLNTIRTLLFIVYITRGKCNFIYWKSNLEMQPTWQAYRSFRPFVRVLLYPPPSNGTQSRGTDCLSIRLFRSILFSLSRLVVSPWMRSWLLSWLQFIGKCLFPRIVFEAMDKVSRQRRRSRVETEIELTSKLFSLWRQIDLES